MMHNCAEPASASERAASKQSRLTARACSVDTLVASLSARATSLDATGRRATAESPTDQPNRVPAEEPASAVHWLLNCAARAAPAAPTATRSTVQRRCDIRREGTTIIDRRLGSVSMGRDLCASLASYSARLSGSFSTE